MHSNDRKLSESMVDAFPHLSPNNLRNQVYKNRLEELAHDVNTRDGYRLIGFFDAFCKEIGADYFAFADTLVGAVVYHDFIPGSYKIEVAMLRKDYFRFEEELCHFLGCENPSDMANVNDSPTGFRLNAYHKSGKARVLLPTVTLTRPEIVEIDGTTIYDKDHLPMHGKAQIEISIFDAIPDDYDLQRVLFYRIKGIYKLYQNTQGVQHDVLSKRLWSAADTYNDRPHIEIARMLSRRSKSIPLDEAFPIRRIPFGPVEIAAPRKTTVWVNEDAESQARQVRYLQEDALFVTKEIDRICRKHNIGYFVCGGTMLGMVRHGGFIPWDDDMDVGMLRADYNRFCEVAKQELREQFFLQTRESDPNIPYLFSKVRLKGTEYITKYNELRDFNKGICVDIFPFDKVPLEYGFFEKHYEQVMRLVRAHNRAANGQVPVDMIARQKAENPVEVLGHAAMSIRHNHFWRTSLAETQRAFVEEVTKYNDDENLHYVASFVPTFTCISLEEMLPYQDIEFEGATLKAIAHPEVFLQMQYGDFMSEPMLHQQRGHGLLRWKGIMHDSDEFEIE